MTSFDQDAVRQKWDSRYREAENRTPTPCAVLSEYAHLLPGIGNALDLACGLGGNAFFLAQRGLTVEAWDISQVAINWLTPKAQESGLAVTARVRDVTAEPPEAERFDVVVVSYFLERDLALALVNALRPGGLLFYQTWTRANVAARGPQNPAYRLEPNELLKLFSGLRVLAYRDEGRSGALDQGLRDEAWLVGQRLA